LPFTVTKLAFDNPAGLKAAVASHGIDILLVCEGLEGDLSAIKEFSHGQKVLTVGSKEPHLSQGLSLGVFFEGDRNSIVVNVKAAGEEGASFSSELLRLAKVIR
jgi:hypothetical protein